MSDQAMPSATIAPPRPEPDDLTRFFWDGCRDHRLLILRCTNCGFHVHWPRPICPACLGEDLAPSQMSGAATLYAYTVSQQAFHPYFADKLPLIVASVELVEQPNLRMVSNLVDLREDEIADGMRLQVKFHEVDDDLVLPLFTRAD